MIRFGGLAAVIAVVGICAPVFAAPTLFNVESISSNDPSGMAGQVGAQAITVGVSERDGQAVFRFSVAEGSYAYNDFYIRSVYFYDGALLSISSIENGPGVLFSEGAKPGHLPGINLNTHKLVSGYELDPVGSAGAGGQGGVAHNGVHMGEWLEVIFSLKTGKDIDDVIEGIQSGAIVIGIKGQGFEDFSESFVSDFVVVPNPPPGSDVVIVPAPGALVLASVGLGCLSMLRRRRAAA